MLDDKKSRGRTEKKGGTKNKKKGGKKKNLFIIYRKRPVLAARPRRGRKAILLKVCRHDPRARGGFLFARPPIVFRDGRARDRRAKYIQD